MVSAKDLGPVMLPLLSRWSRLSNSSPKSLSFFLAENDCLNAKLQLELLENLSVCTHFARMFVRWRSPAQDMLLSTLMPVSLSVLVSDWMASARACGKSRWSFLNFLESSQNRESFMGGSAGKFVNATRLS